MKLLSKRKYRRLISRRRSRQRSAGRANSGESPVDVEAASALAGKLDPAFGRSLVQAQNWLPRESIQRLHSDDIRHFQQTVEKLLGGFRYSSIGICGLYGSERSLLIGSSLAHSISETLGLTTVVVKAGNQSVGSTYTGSGPSTRTGTDLIDGWKAPVLAKTVNFWTAPTMAGTLPCSPMSVDLVRWLRHQSHLVVTVFDSMASVYDHRELARDLDGVVVINDGQLPSLELMRKSMPVLRRERIKLLGQVRNFGAI